MKLCRVYQPPDEPARVYYPQESATDERGNRYMLRRKGESDAEFLDRMGADEVGKDPSKAGLPYVDVEQASLPAYAEPCSDPDCDEEHPVRDSWRIKDGKVAIDRNLPNEHAAAAHRMRDLRRELEKPNPDPIRVARLQHGISIHGQGSTRA